jgi:hypothetical protein
VEGFTGVAFNPQMKEYLIGIISKDKAILMKVNSIDFKLEI